tara:strand:- start:401 stop:727 length:327 start_codon:yes stop_codon:yes gene_type:complete
LEFPYISFEYSIIVEILVRNCIEFNSVIHGLMRPNKLIRKLGNKLGLAWWAKVETKAPDVIYWFGPFLTKKSLKGNLEIFLSDLNEEGSKNISHSLIRCKRNEPLTIQ